MLAPSARVALKVVNAEPIVANFRATEVEERDGTIVKISRALTGHPIRLIEQLSITGPHGSDNYERRQRLYAESELSAALYRAGLAVSAVFASASGVAFDSASSRTMLIIGERLPHAA